MKYTKCLRNIIFSMIFTSVCVLSSVGIVNACYGYPDHSWESSESYGYRGCDLFHHYVIEKCWLCGATRYELKEEHEWSNDQRFSIDEDNYKKYDDTYHYVKEYCTKCGETKHEKMEEHHWKDGNHYKKCDSIFHFVEEYCEDCNITRYVKKEKHKSYDNIFSFNDYTILDDTYHSLSQECYNCQTVYPTKGKHDWCYIEDYNNDFEHRTLKSAPYKKSDTVYHFKGEVCEGCGKTRYIKTFKHVLEYYGTKYIDANYQKSYWSCSDCTYEKCVKEKHSLDYSDFNIKKKASLYEKGSVLYYCDECCKYVPRTSTWKYNSKLSVSYAITHSKIYKNSKYVTIKFKSPIKNATLTVKIGSKKYQKKITTSTQQVKINIKNPAFKSSITMSLTYNGQTVGKNASGQVVWYATKIKNGMTKEQVKYTWGSPSHTSSSSGGYSYWDYKDGSCVCFKNGKVIHWYNASK